LPDAKDGARGKGEEEIKEISVEDAWLSRQRRRE
jgi:hypothetical protein